VAGSDSHYELIHPEWLILVYEVGSNTSEGQSGAISGQTYLCSKTGSPQQRSVTIDAHFTVIGFTSTIETLNVCNNLFWKDGERRV
jgi:hypothetical protein